MKREESGLRHSASRTRRPTHFGLEARELYLSFLSGQERLDALKRILRGEFVRPVYAGGSYECDYDQ